VHAEEHLHLQLAVLLIRAHLYFLYRKMFLLHRDSSWVKIKEFHQRCRPLTRGERRRSRRSEGRLGAAQGGTSCCCSLTGKLGNDTHNGRGLASKSEWLEVRGRAAPIALSRDNQERVERSASAATRCAWNCAIHLFCGASAPKKGFSNVRSAFVRGRFIEAQR
jgi:hypothetical protein